MSNRGRHKKKKKSKYSFSWISNVLSDDIIDKILEYQKHQSRYNIADLRIFERDPYAGASVGGFNWRDTKEGHEYWNHIFNKVNDYRLIN